MSLWRRALRLALRPSALTDDAVPSKEVLEREQQARREVLWRAGVLGVVLGAGILALGALVARAIERRLREATGGGWDFGMNLWHDVPWVIAALGGIFVLTGLLRLLGAAFPWLLGSSRGASLARIAVVALLGAGLFVAGAVLLRDVWTAI